ncbi:MAG: hypothetical protein LBG27_07575 [Spirochaetaceae bacterium]|nr:hypothetical protein [Spirochaetaceae bacterium]
MVFRNAVFQKAVFWTTVFRNAAFREAAAVPIGVQAEGERRPIPVRTTVSGAVSSLTPHCRRSAAGHWRD